MPAPRSNPAHTARNRRTPAARSVKGSGARAAAPTQDEPPARLPDLVIFDATEDPQSWLRAFERNRDEIIALAESLLATMPGQKVVLLRLCHFQVLPQYADRPENPVPSAARMAA
jgi:hypothetical protein